MEKPFTYLDNLPNTSASKLPYTPPGFTLLHGEDLIQSGADSLLESNNGYYTS